MQGSRTSDAAGLSAGLRRRIIALQRSLVLAATALTSKATPKRIHAVRVAARRLDALLHAFRRQLDPRSAKRYRRALKALVHDLEEAREADVMRRSLGRLKIEAVTDIRVEAGALHEEAVKAYRSALQSLRSKLAAAPWARRLSRLQRLSDGGSMVPENDEPAASVIIRRADHARRRLRSALHRAGKNISRLHKLRLRVKHVRYFLEDVGAGMPHGAARELRGLRRLQDCLGELHDEENLRDWLRERRMPARATRGIVRELERRKRARFKEFKKCRKDLMERWRDLA